MPRKTCPLGFHLEQLDPVAPGAVALTPAHAEVALSLCKELKERVYRLRYQIYVEELGYKLANDGQMLHDKYDG